MFDRWSAKSTKHQTIKGVNRRKLYTAISDLCGIFLLLAASQRHHRTPWVWVASCAIGISFIDTKGEIHFYFTQISAGSLGSYVTEYHKLL